MTGIVALEPYNAKAGSDQLHVTGPVPEPSPESLQ